jgi:hypothetical protein
MLERIEQRQQLERTCIEPRLLEQGLAAQIGARRPPQQAEQPAEAVLA